MTRANLKVLGCDGGYPGPGGAGSGYLVRMAGATVCLDMGPGVLARLQMELPLSGLDAVVVSHEHPDHRADLEALAVALHFADRSCCKDRTESSRKVVEVVVVGKG